LFDNSESGEIAGRVRPAVIASGSENEASIAAKVRNNPDPDAFPRQEIMPEGVLSARKRRIDRSRTLDFAGSEPDFMVFKGRGGRTRRIARPCTVATGTGS